MQNRVEMHSERACVWFRGCQRAEENVLGISSTTSDSHYENPAFSRRRSGVLRGSTVRRELAWLPQ